jgi:nucleotide-binding universal stress UspA family protein
MVKPLFQNILVAINSSETSIHAAQYAILMAKSYRCNIKAVYVVDTATLKQLTLSKFFVPEESAEYEQNLIQDGTRYLEYVASLGAQKGVKIETELRKGAIWTEVIAAAEDIKANLILLDSGATSNSAIIANTPCSVLVVWEKQIEQLFKLA